MPAQHATSAEVINLVCELAPHAGPLLDAIVALTASLIEIPSWGDKAFDGHWTLAAHVATMVLGTNSAVGAVTSRKIDKIQETYAAGGPALDVELASTRYGRMHALLKSSLVASSHHGADPRGWELPDARIL
jgi:hypothetical protein